MKSLYFFTFSLAFIFQSPDSIAAARKALLPNDVYKSNHSGIKRSAKKKIRHNQPHVGEVSGKDVAKLFTYTTKEEKGFLKKGGLGILAGLVGLAGLWLSLLSPPLWIISSLVVLSFVLCIIAFILGGDNRKYAAGVLAFYLVIVTLVGLYWIFGHPD